MLLKKIANGMSGETMSKEHPDKVGRFMVAVGAVIVHKKSGKILLLKRRDTFHKDTWEILYGRIDNHEELEIALRREIEEESGLSQLEIIKLNHVWHIYRGEKDAEKEVYGFTFIVETDQDQCTMSHEHSQYSWVTPQEALTMIATEGIRQDVELYLKSQRQPDLILTDINKKEFKI